MKSARLTRLKGVLIALAGGTGFAIAFYAVYVYGLEAHTYSTRANVGYLILLALPGAFFLAGTIQAITGKTLSQSEACWGGLRGWKRGLIGGIVVLLSLFMLIGIFMLAVSTGSI